MVLICLAGLSHCKKMIQSPGAVLIWALPVWYDWDNECCELVNCMAYARLHRNRVSECQWMCVHERFCIFLCACLSQTLSSHLSDSVRIITFNNEKNIHRKTWEKVWTHHSRNVHLSVRAWANSEAICLCQKRLGKRLPIFLLNAEIKRASFHLV